MKLKDIFEKPISGEWGKEVGEGEKGSKVIRTTNFTNIGRLDLSSIVERDIDSIKHENKKLKFGDIIIEKSGGSPTQPVGRVVIFEETNEDVYFCNNFTSILRPNKNIVPKFGLYLLKNLYNKKKVLKFQNKTTGIINIKLNDYLNNTEITIPNLEVQNRIAEVLNKTQELIDKRKEQIESLDELVKIEIYRDVW
ncbi:restriction endonuclease subunit S [Clostridium perfringens]